MVFIYCPSATIQLARRLVNSRAVNLVDTYITIIIIIIIIIIHQSLLITNHIANCTCQYAMYR